MILKQYNEEEMQHQISFHSINNFLDADYGNHCKDGRLDEEQSSSPSPLPISSLYPPIQLPGFEETCLFGPCNGIVCVTDVHVWDKICLCNPATGEVKNLPSCPFRRPEDFTYEPIGIGLGFDTFTNDYKVIRILHRCSLHEVFTNGNYGPCIALVYSLNTNSWRELSDDHCISPHVVYVSQNCTGLLFHGSYHWLVDYVDDWPMPWSISPNFHQSVLSFDMRTEVFDVMQHPYVGAEKASKLVSLDDSLALIKYTLLDPLSIEIWVMREYGIEDSWTKKLSVGPLSSVGYHCPVSLIWNHDNQHSLLLSSRLSRDPDDLDPDSDQLTSSSLVGATELKLYDFYGPEPRTKKKKSLGFSIHGLIYAESLVSLRPQSLIID